MNSNSMLRFDVAEQLKQIESFTQQQQQEVQALIEESRTQCESDELFESASNVEEQVTDMLSEIGAQLDREITKINQQLQQLLPNEI